MGKYVVETRIKEEIAKPKEMFVSSDFFEELDRQVESLIVKAIERAKANGRKTIRTSDL